MDVVEQEREQKSCYFGKYDLEEIHINRIEGKEQIEAVLLGQNIASHIEEISS